jgi:hypothetical protein
MAHKAQVFVIEVLSQEAYIAGTDLLAACLPVFELANGVRTIPRRRAVALHHHHHPATAR